MPPVASPAPSAFEECLSEGDLRSRDGSVPLRYIAGAINTAMNRQPSARFMLRMPASLREQLGLAAASEGVSMNQFAC
jgi:hypothetical protein